MATRPHVARVLRGAEASASIAALSLTRSTRAFRPHRVMTSTTGSSTRRRIATPVALLSKIAPAAKTKPPKAPPAGTDADAAAFKAAGAILAVPTLPTLVAPDAVEEAFNVTHSGGWADPSAFERISDVQHFSNVVGTDCFALIALCALYVLADAAENARLDSATYQRLALATVLYGGGSTLGVALAVAAGALDPSLTPSPSIAALVGTTLAFAPAMAASASAINKYGGGLKGAKERAAADLSTVTNLGDTSEKGGYLEYYYKLSFWASMIVGGAFAFSPLSPLAIVNEFTPSGQIVQRAFGLGAVFMLAPAQFVLLDACRRGRLGGGTFKKLNLAVAAAIAGIDAMTVYTFGAAQALSPDAAVLADASGGIYNYVGALAVSFSIFGVYLYQGIFARK